MVFHDELENVDNVIDNPVLVQEKYWLQFEADVTFEFLKDGHTYTLTCYDGTNVVYRDKIMCTNQTINSYSINNNVYFSNATTNEFIIYE